MLARRSLLPLPLLLLAGCVPLQFLDSSLGEPETPMVPTNPFGSPAPVQQTAVKASYSPASGEMALRVDVVRHAVLAANPSLAVRPVAATIGAPHAEIFHQGTHIIYVTEGLIKRCKNDGEIAALLCLELGKMVAEREARLGSRGRTAGGRPPIDVPIGNAGQFNTSDQVALAELGRYEEERRQATKRRPPPDPQDLAAEYLVKAGYGKEKLDAIGPLLQDADRNYLIEKQFNTPSNAPAWSPVATP
jgi:hypothetical protein